jgi:hypothetical protein
MHKFLFLPFFFLPWYRAPSASAKPEVKPETKKEKPKEEKLTPQERLKLKMRMALNKTSMPSLLDS